jgi:hypothetical protein
VFDETGKEWICRKVRLLVPSWTAIDQNGHDWNIVCDATMKIDKPTSTIYLDRIKVGVTE